ncbi:MAG: cbb3-type cytochrome c oxidase N-terminal domain-containing protein [Gemmatimonadaceae bacterium]
MTVSDNNAPNKNPGDKQKKPEKQSKQAQVLEHSYDGIQEYDNPMPRWWLLTFAGTIIFSVVYLFNVGPIGRGKGPIADYEADMKAFAAAHPSTGDAPVSAEVLVALSKDAAAMQLGKQTFTTNCVSCHGADGGGMIGPNLTDKFWLHGSTLPDIYKTIANGVLDKGMPPWSKILKPEQVRAVTVYVGSLKGTTPANPKAAQGAPETP